MFSCVISRLPPQDFKNHSQYTIEASVDIRYRPYDAGLVELPLYQLSSKWSKLKSQDDENDPGHLAQLVSEN